MEEARYCVYEPYCQRFTYYESSRRRSAIKPKGPGPRDAKRRGEQEHRHAPDGATAEHGYRRRGRYHVESDGTGNKHGPRYEFKFNTSEGRVFELYVEKATEPRVARGDAALGRSTLTMGYLHKRKHGSKKNTFDRGTRRLRPGRIYSAIMSASGTQR